MADLGTEMEGESGLRKGRQTGWNAALACGMVEGVRGERF
jgi:hypothetical protein